MTKVERMNSTMQAAILTDATICKSSLRECSGSKRLPYGDFIPGHEYAGIVSALGEGVDEKD